MLAILKEVGKRVVDQTKDSALEKQATELRREISNLAEAVAVTKGNVSALTPKLAERQVVDHRGPPQAAQVRAGRVFTGGPPRRRVEVGVRKRIDHLNELLGRDVKEARKVIESLLDGPMKFTPVETPDGRRYEVTGRIATGDVLPRALTPGGGTKRRSGYDQDQVVSARWASLRGRI